MLNELKKQVCAFNQLLPKEGLVTMTSGNCSGLDRETNLVVIKPSGVSFDKLSPDKMCVVDLNGRSVEGHYKPSTDTPTHLYVYRHLKHVGGIAHTHSNYATSFAALGKSIPPYLTAIADEFGGAIPIGKYCKIGGDEIGQEIVRIIGNRPAILMKNHGVFTVGKGIAEAFKAAVMVEDVAKTVHLSLLIGKPKLIPAQEVDRGHKRYMEKYGQG